MLQAPLGAMSFAAEQTQDKNDAKTIFALKKNSVPAGFENLAKPQQSAIDVYFASQYITTIQAQYSPGRITFFNPDQIVEAINSINYQDKEIVSIAMRGELNSNEDLVCSHKNQTDCGRISPPIAAVIFDETTFRADLFINPNYLEVSGFQEGRYLPKSNAEGWSVLQNLGIVYARSDSFSEDYSLIGNSALSLRENSIRSNWDYSRTLGARIDTLFYQRDFEGQDIQAGIFRTQSSGLSFTSDQKILGGRFATSLNTRTDRQFAQSSDIQIFLPTPSQVDVLKDGRLLSSAFYDAGNQLIDTSGLPSGAYDISLRIIDEGGSIALEDRFFVKELALPPKDELQYFAELGEGLDQFSDRTLPETAGEFVLRGGVNWRLRDNLGAEFSGAFADGNTVLEAGMIGLGRKHRTQGSLLLSTDSDFGYTARSRWHFGAFSASLDTRQLIRKEENESTNTEIDPIIIGNTELQRVDDLFQLLPNQFTQHSFSMNYAFARGGVNYRLTYLDGRYSRAQTIQNIGYTQTLSQTGSDTLVFSANLSHGVQGPNDELIATVGLTYNFRNKRWTHTAVPQVRYRNASNQQAPVNKNISETALRGNWRSSWRDGDQLPGDLRVTGRAIADTESTNSLGTEIDYSSSYGRATLSMDYLFNQPDNVDSSTGSNARISLSAYTGFISNFDQLAWGGQSLAESAVLVDIDGDAKGAMFDVYINEYRRGYAKLGEPTVMQLAPFKEYKVRIKPRDNIFVGYDDKVQAATLYPGNVVSLNWEANEISIAFGRIVDSNNKPIANAIVEGAYGIASTDGAGIFQVELLKQKNRLLVVNDDSGCFVDLPADAPKNNGVLNFGTLVCKE